MEQTHSLPKCARIRLSSFCLKLAFFLFFFTNYYHPINAQYEHVVINEISGDGGNIEAGNDAIVELAGPVGTDIGCMVITNTEWAIVLPAGTKIPADGVFLIACSERNNVSNGYYTGIKTGLSCDVCDFPGLVIDFDVCAPTNVSYVSPSVYSTYGFTLDNQPQSGNKDGDQVILFRPDGTPHDAVYWGASDQTKSNGGGTTIGGSSGNAGTASDHVSVQINHPYTLGDNDENGIINDNLNAHIGYRANGANAVGVYFMPFGNDDLGNPTLFGTQIITPPGDCNAHQKKFTVPGLSDPVWVNVGLNLTSCNSTHIRLNDTSPIGNSRQEPRTSTTSSHKDDPDLNADWKTFAATALIPSSVNSTVAATQWQITNHPNPSQPNDADSWDFFYDIGAGKIEITEQNIINLSLCNAQTVEFELKVYNYQHVEPNSRSSKLAGSFIRDENGNDQDWTIASVGHDNTEGNASSNDDGTTTFRFTSNNLTGGTTHTFTLVWDDYTDCCGSGKNSTVVNQSVAHECYEKVKVNIKVAEVLTVSDNVITCPGDFSANVGFIDFSKFVTSPNALVQYQLKENVTPGLEEMTGTVVETNTTGLFNLVNTLTPPLAIVVEDLANCGTNQIITIAENCRNAPPCPNPAGATIDKNKVCPNEDFTLSINANLSTDLPNGGTIDWYYGTTGFDPSNNEGTLLGKSAITITNPGTPTSGLAINEVLVDADNNDGNGGEFIEIAGSPNTDVSCYILTDGDDEIILPKGTLIPSDGYLLIASGINTTAPKALIDVDLDICNCFSDPLGSNGGADLQFTNHSATNGEFLFMYDANGTFVDGVLWGGPSAGGGNNHPDAQATKTLTIAPTGCSPPAMITRSGQAFTDMNIKSMANGVSIELDKDITGNWQLTDDAAKSTPGATNTGAVSVVTVTDLTTNLGDELCNQNIEIRGIVRPANITPLCLTETVMTAALSLTIDCPKADLQMGDKSLCLPVNNSEVLAAVHLSGGSGIYNVTLDMNYNGTTFPLVKSNVSHPLSITYSDIATALGVATFSDVALSINHIAETGGKLCAGKKNEEVVILSVQASPTATLSVATDLTDCSGAANGSITITFSPPNSGPWEFEYTLDGGNPIVTTANISPFILPVSTAGTYALQSVNNIAGCSGTIDGGSQIVNAPNPLNVVSVDKIKVCNDGSKTVDLNKDFTISINDGGSIVEGNGNTIGNVIWYQSNPILLPSTLRNTIEITTTSFTPTTTETYYFIYKRPADNCEVIGETMIEVSGTNCCLANAGDLIAPTIPTNFCTGGDLAAFSVSYTATDETMPDATNFDYQFLLTKDATILQTSTKGDFDFTNLAAGKYNVYGLSYAKANTPNDLSTYLSTIQNDADKNDIAQIETDESGLNLCLNIDGLVESGLNLIEIVNNAACCLADAGDIIAPTIPSNFCTGGDLAAFSVSYAAADETMPDATNFDYQFLLTKDQNILQTSTTGDFNFTNLAAGKYNVYGISYAKANTPNDLSTYLSTIQNDANQNDIAQIETDESGLAICLNIDGLVESGLNLIEIVNNAACCLADAGDIIAPTIPINFCTGGDLAAFSVSYAAADETMPDATNFDYQFLLTKDQTILQTSTTGDFDFTNLAAGKYNIYGISYAKANNPNDLSNYLSTIQNDADKDDISQIETDESGLAFCLNIDGLVESGLNLIEIVNNAACCLADAGDIIAPTIPINFCTGGDLAAFSVSYAAADETMPDATNFDYQFLLTKDQTILQTSTTGDFDFTNLATGKYNIYGISYAKANNPNDLSTYLSTIQNDADKDDISQIETDESGLDFCLDLDGLVESGLSLIEIVNNAACCLADAGDIIAPTIPTNFCTGGDLAAFSASYAAADETMPDATKFDYQFLLTKDQNVLQTSTTGDFDFTNLATGKYNVYGISYAKANTPNNLSTYLSTIQNDADKDDISQIETDESGLIFCLNIDGLVESGLSMIEIVNNAACCLADAGDLIAPTIPSNFCVGGDLATFSVSYTATDETMPDAANFDYQFLLTKDQTILQTSTTGDFDFTNLAAGKYNIYGISYAKANNPNDLSTYLSTIQNDADKNDIAQIETDESGLAICLNIDGLVESGLNLIEIVNNAACCLADAGDLVLPSGFSPSKMLLGEDIPSIKVSYAATDETMPDARKFQYYFILTTGQTILDISKTGDFDFTNLPIGHYNVHGVSYANANSPNILSAYLSNIRNDADKNDLAQIKTDESNLAYCLDMTDLAESGLSLIQINQPRRTIPTMSQWGLLIFSLLVLNLGLIFVRKLEITV